MIVLDAGALIALERNDRAMWAALKAAAIANEEVLVPATALAQVWRNRASQATLARALGNCVVASFDGVAREVGELCGKSRMEDICDAHVALVAATHGATLYTSDTGDMRRLVDACRKKRVVIVAC
ncbi:MAG: type II toxin-antitoxin system VapC family toxin [Polyangiaceae bacterium]